VDNHAWNRPCFIYRSNDLYPSTQMIHTLEADGISLSFGERNILSDIYLKCTTGEITGLLSRNGQGKSCLLNIIYGSLKAQSRSIRFDGQPLFEAYKSHHQLNYLPQFSFIPSTLTLSRIFKDFELDFKEFEAFLPEFEGRKAVKIGKLSGGQRRLVEVYLIVKSKSQFSMLDEPFSHLMPLHVEKIQSLILSMKNQKGFLITDHLFESIISISDQLYLLKEGKMHLTTSRANIAWLGYAKI
jgi:ABC-type multidrug transport system ATPase subunit